MKAEDITDHRSFEAWLKSRPEEGRREVAVAMASRSALQVVPFSSFVDVNKPELRAFAIKQVFWCNLIVRAGRAWPDIKLKRAAIRAVGATNSVGEVAASPAPAPGVVSVIAALSVAAYAAAAVLDNDPNRGAPPDPFNASPVDASVLAALGVYACAFEDTWKHIRDDAKWIEGGDYPFRLYATILFSPQLAWWVNGLADF